MALSYVSELKSEVVGGFDMANHYRNEWLFSAEGGSLKWPEMYKTGTTICGLICGDDTVVIASDTRCTVGSRVAQKKTHKIYGIGSNMLLAGAGTASDMLHMAAWLNRSVTLSELNMKGPVRAVHAATVLSNELFKYQGHIQFSSIVGGVDYTGASLYRIQSDGSTSKEPYLSMGSGSLNAASQLEIGYRKDLTKEEGIELAAKAIRSGVFNDLGSGNGITISYVSPTEPPTIKFLYEDLISPLTQDFMPFPLGTTKYFSERIESVAEKKSDSNAPRQDAAYEEVEMAA